MKTVVFIRAIYIFPYDKKIFKAEYFLIGVC